MIRISAKSANPDLTFTDSWGYEYKIKVMGKKFYFIEKLPNEEVPFIFEDYLLTPKEMIETFEDGTEIDREILKELREIIKNISMKIARMRNA